MSPAILYLVTTKSSAMVFSFSSLSAMFSDFNSAGWLAGWLVFCFVYEGFKLPRGGRRATEKVTWATRQVALLRDTPFPDRQKYSILNIRK